MSSLFSLDNILLNEEYHTPAEVNLSNIPTVQSFSQYCPLVEGYKYILEMQSSNIDAEKRFIASILESYGDEQLIKDSYDTVIKEAKDTVDNTIQWVKDATNKFTSKVKSYFKEELKTDNPSERTRILEAVKKFEDKDEFDIDGYKYTIKLTEDGMYKTPSITHLKKVAEMTRQFDNTDERLNEVTNTFTDLKENYNDYVGRYRGELVAGDEPITQSEYTDELFKLFRDGSMDKVKITVNKNYLENVIADTTSGSQEWLREAEETGKRMVGYLNNLSDAYMDSNADLELEGESAQKVMELRKLYYKMIQEYCEIVTQATSAKIQAMKDCIQQENMVLNKVCGIVNKNSEVGGSDNG